MDERWNISTAAYVFGQTERTIRNWMKTKPDFPKRGDDKRWLATDLLAYAGKYHLATRRG